MLRADDASMGLSQGATVQAFTILWGQWKAGSQRLSSLPENSEQLIGKLLNMAS